MNNKGFTLIELVSTLALLAVISVISFVSITSIVNNSKVTNCENLVQNIKMAAKEYASDNRYNNSFINEVINAKITIKVDTLTDKNNKYLVEPIIDPFDSNAEIPASNISVQIDFNTYNIDNTDITDYTVKNVTVLNNNGVVVNCNSGSW